MFSSNVECDTCRNCDACSDCTNCDGCLCCSKSKDLVSCKSCYFCYGCTDCENCTDCTNCNQCVDCAFCDGLVGKVGWRYNKPPDASKLQNMDSPLPLAVQMVRLKGGFDAPSNARRQYIRNRKAGSPPVREDFQVFERMFENLYPIFRSHNVHLRKTLECAHTKEFVFAESFFTFYLSRFIEESFCYSTGRVNYMLGVSACILKSLQRNVPFNTVEMPEALKRYKRRLEDLSAKLRNATFPVIRPAEIGQDRWIVIEAMIKERFS